MVIVRKPVACLAKTALSRFLARAQRAIRLRGTVNVLVTSSRELRLLNRRFRGVDTPTDVLSFVPAFDNDRRFAGDLAISADIAARNARLLGHAPALEIKILALHGLLHLAGYNHESDGGEMARKEERLRKQLGLPRALTGRVPVRSGSRDPNRELRSRRAPRSRAGASSSGRRLG